MRNLFILAIHLRVTVLKLVRPGGVRAVAAESLLLKHQLPISNRSRHRAPNLTTLDRCLLALATLFLSPRRLPKLGALVKPATLLKFHKALVDRKYCRLFFSRHRRRKPGPIGPSGRYGCCVSLRNLHVPDQYRGYGQFHVLDRRLRTVGSLPDRGGL